MRLSSEDEVAVADPVEARPASDGSGIETETARQPFIVRLLPSFTDVLFLMPIIILLRIGGPRMLLGDGDTGWHLRAGEWMLANKRVPDRDFFSFSMPDRPWFAWEWLWELVFGWMHLHWGMAAVLCGCTLVLAITFALLYRLVLRTAGNPVIAVAVSLGACFVTSIHWLARPHLFTLLFVVVFCSLIERAESGRTRLLLWLPALMVLWTNLHGGFMAGLILTAAYCAGALVRWAIDPSESVRRQARMQARRYALVTAACAAATFINPYGYQLHVHIYRYLSDPYMVQNISEFLSLNFTHPIGKYFEAFLLVGVMSAMWSCYRRQFVFPILFISWTHMALVSVRHIPVLVILTAPVAAQCIADMIRSLREADVSSWLRRSAEAVHRSGIEIGQIERIGRVPLLQVFIAGVLLLLLLAQPSETFRAEYDPKTYPAGAVALLSGPGFQTGVFAPDIWGGYLVYRLYPHFKDFIDGRSDFYGQKFDQKYIDVMNCKHDWQQTLDRYRIHTVVLPVDTALAGTLRESARWRAVYDDHIAIVFRKVSAAASAALEVPAVTDGGISAIARSRTPNPVIPMGHHSTRGD